MTAVWCCRRPLEWGRGACTPEIGRNLDRRGCPWGTIIVVEGGNQGVRCSKSPYPPVAPFDGEDKNRRRRIPRSTVAVESQSQLTTRWAPCKGGRPGGFRAFLILLPPRPQDGCADLVLPLTLTPVWAIISTVVVVNNEKACNRSSPRYGPLGRARAANMREGMSLGRIGRVETLRNLGPPRGGHPSAGLGTH